MEVQGEGITFFSVRRFSKVSTGGLTCPKLTTLSSLSSLSLVLLDLFPLGLVPLHSPCLGNSKSKTSDFNKTTPCYHLKNIFVCNY